MDQTPYILLALCGQSPQVITETIWSLGVEHGRLPEQVHILTTAVGAAYVQARLLNTPARDPRTNKPIEPASAWDALAGELEVVALPDPVVHIPEAYPGQPLLDIRGLRDDQSFADACYALVEELTQNRLPVVGSLSGGRKTMSAHAMTAFVLNARAIDRLVHVLVQPHKFERDAQFFFPTADQPEAIIQRVDLPFPRIRHLLNEDLLPSDADGPRTLRRYQEIVQPHLQVERDPTGLDLRIASDGLHLTLHFVNGEAIHGRLPPGLAASFVVLADAIKRADGHVPREDLLSDNPRNSEGHPVHRAREAMAKVFNLHATLAPWTFNEDLGKVVNRLHSVLNPEPALREYLRLELSEAGESTGYNWAQGHSSYASWNWFSDAPIRKGWPLSHIDPPVDRTS